MTPFARSLSAVRPRFLASVFALAAAALATASLLACPVPVYQYALEHWETDPYVLVARTGAQLNDAERSALDLLREAAAGAPATNLELRVEEAAQGEADGSATLELRYPEASGIRKPVWSGELTLENAAALIDSPTRKAIVEALMERTSAVWVFLESGDARADREAEGELRRQLDRAAKEIVVPESAEWGGETVKIDNQVNFAVLRVRRDDPAERLFVEMLLNSEPDLKSDFDDQPMAFPVYGRGLLLYALVGKGINQATIRAATDFLTGPCSCQIKAANPGLDLLLAADWAAGIEATTPAAVGTTTGAGGFLQRLDEAEGEAEGQATQEAP